MTKFNLKLQGLTLIVASALMLSPTASADCVSQCEADWGACASGVGSGAGAAGGAFVSCFGTVSIAISVFGDAYSCSAVAYQQASSCEGDDGGGDTEIIESKGFRAAY